MLNLFRPTRPRLLGVPPALAGFDALKQDLGPDVIPAAAPPAPPRPGSVTIPSR